MIFAEFQTLSTGWNGKDFSGPKEPTSALGTDGVLKLDSRKRRSNQIADVRKHAEELNRLRGNSYIGFKLFAGPSYSDCRPLENGKMFKL